MSRAHLEAMGIDVWRLRATTRAVPPAAPDRSDAAPPTRQAPPRVEQPAHTVDPRGDIAAMDWEALRAAVAACRACPLHAGRTQTVFGVGDTRAEWLFIGEAPGADEDRLGEPFVGRAGQLLTSILFALGMTREQVYIANVLKCRPPRNRDPERAESLCCQPFLDRQIALIEPKIIVALGRIAVQQLLQTDAPLARMRGRVHHYATAQRRIPTIVTYHPAYLLRSPQEKAKVWADLQFARRTVAGLKP
jgi:DNA polymerase